MSHNLVVYGYNPWSTMWKRTQTLVDLLSQDDRIRDVLFVNPPIYMGNLIRRPHFELKYRRLQCWQYFLPKRVQKKITVFTPLIPPYSAYGKPLCGLRRFMEMHVMRSYIQDRFMLYINRLVPLFDPIFWSLFPLAEYKLFDWSDDFSTFTDDPEIKKQCDDITTRYLKTCDLIITINDTLTDRAKSLNSNAHTIRNATNYHHFRLADASDTQTHRKCSELAKPIIGYIGFMNRARLDIEMINDVATARPNWNFVFVGPTVHDEPLGPDLPRLHNVHIFPPVAYQKLPEVIKTFDVCIIPNKINDHTNGNDPIKLFDYLASGRQVVSTRTAGTDCFDGVIKLADTSAEFIKSIELCLSSTSDDNLSDRLSLARSNSWDVRVEELKRLMWPSIHTGIREQ